jgi:hypothetical protein
LIISVIIGGLLIMGCTNGKTTGSVIISRPSVDAMYGEKKVVFSWNGKKEASLYHLQVSKEPQFRRPYIDKKLDATMFRPEQSFDRGGWYVRVKWCRGLRRWSRWSKGVRFFVKSASQSKAVEKYFRSKTIGGPGTEEWPNLCRTDDGGYLLAAGSDSFGDGDKDLLVIKTDIDGNIEWQNVYGGPEDDKPGALGKGIIRTDDGNYLISAVTGSWGESGGFNPWLIKIRPDGSIVWQKWFGNEFSNYHRCICAEDFAGNIIVTTIYQSSEDQDSRDIWIIKLEHDGEKVLWQRTYGGNEGDYPYICVISKAGYYPGDYLIAGFTYSQDIGFFDPNVSNALFLRISPEKGMVRVARYYGWDSDWYEYDYFTDM